MAERGLSRTVLPFALTCSALGLVARLVNTGEARPLWSARSFPAAPWLALALLCGLLIWARRGLRPLAQVRFLAGWRLAFALLVCTSLFVLFADRSMSGDFVRVLYDIDRGVWLLKAEPLGPASFQLLARLGDALGLPRILGLQWLLALSSGAGMYLVYRLAHTLAPPSALGDLRFVALLSSATSALFFGHIETYTLPTLAMVGYLIAAQRVLEARGRLAPACLLFALACALHMEMLCLGPSLLVCALYAAPRTSWRRVLLDLCLCGALPILAIQLLSLRFPPPYPQYYGGGDRTMLVRLPLLASAPYWFGVLGILGTFAPGAVAGAGLLALRRQNSAPWNAQMLFAAALAGTFLTFVLLWNPDLGYFRDWDLFAPAGLALTFAALLGLARLPESTQAVALLALLVTNLMRSLPFILDNARL
jgi:hypothetical protein